MNPTGHLTGSWLLPVIRRRTAFGTDSMVAAYVGIRMSPPPPGPDAAAAGVAGTVNRRLFAGSRCEVGATAQTAPFLDRVAACRSGQGAGRTARWPDLSGYPVVADDLGRRRSVGGALPCPAG